MKKSLVLTLALVFVLGIAGTAFAANPFTDVPANHWAYPAVTKLAEQGIVEGYGDGRFIGSQNMTRYEMAQIVAKALARSDMADAAMRAQIERLAAEFADELDSLGVRVARLERNADNVRITGEGRFSYYGYDRSYRDNKDDRSRIRTRLWLRGEVNDNWTYGAMVENNTQNFRTNEREDVARLRRAWVQGNIGELEILAGRYAYKPVFGTVLDNDVAGINIGYNNQDYFKITGFAMRPYMSNFWYDTDRTLDGVNYDTYYQNVQVYGAEVAFGLAEGLRLVGAYYRTEGRDNHAINGNIYEAGLDYQWTNNLGIWGQWIHSSRPENGAYGIPGENNMSRDGWAAGLRLSKIERNRPGTFEIRGAYYDVPATATFDTSPELNITGRGDGYKGWTVGASIVAARNVDINVDYFDFEGHGDFRTEKDKEKLIWSYVRFYF